MNREHFRGRMTRVSWQAYTMAALTIVTSMTARVRAQEPAPAYPASRTRSDESTASAALDRTIAVHFDHVTLRQALAGVSAQTGLRFAYSRQHVPLATVVTLVADRITVHNALDQLLQGTGLRVDVSASGVVQLVPASGGSAASAGIGYQGAGSLRGRVIDAKTEQPLSGVTVVVDATGFRAATTTDGQYTIAGVAPGSYRITARVLGHAPLTQPATVFADSTTHLDFTLQPVAATLDEVVTTGAGQQRRVEIGNAVATINADSVVRTAPVINVTDVLSGRAPGVEVLQTNGMAGSGPSIRVRGRGSVTLSNDPIYIVDGVRMDGSPGGQGDAFTIASPFGSSTPTPSRLNDLDPEEIETIEVLRGPSASTEYGTDAANGVVVITTKRGHAGAPRWSATVEHGLSDMPATFPDNYYSWGHTTGATPAATQCPLVPFTIFGPPFTPGSTAGQCVVDSVTRWQPLNHASTSLFGTGNRGHYELQVSGGAAQTQYFLAGGLTDEIGALQMPETEAARIARERGQAIPRDQLRPNAIANTSLRGRVSTGQTGVFGLSATAAYIETDQRSPDQTRLLYNALTGPGIRDSLSGYGGSPASLFSFFANWAPGTVLATMGSETVNRFTGGLTGTWRPAAWLNGRATAGIDQGHRTDVVLALPGQGVPFCFGAACSNPQAGYRSLGEYPTSLYTVDLGATATAPISSLVTSKTSVGMQYNDRRDRGSVAVVDNLAIGNPTLNGGTVLGTLEQRYEAATLGSYAEELVSVAERLFLTGAIRVDAGSGFGTSYKAAAYPKASASWVVAPEHSRGASLRLRAAYGQSGVQPPAGSALQLYAPSQTYYSTGLAPNIQLSSVGTPGLRPEHTTELEGGFDGGLFGDRLRIEATGYSKLSHDALVSIPLAGSVGAGTQLVNLGSVRNRGLELSLTARVLDARAAQWDVTLSGSDNENRLVSLGRGVAPIDQTGSGPVPYKQTPGFPLYGLWAYRIHYADGNHDGIIEPSEVTIDSVTSYVGPSLAPRQVSLNTGLTILGGHIRLGGQTDYRGGQYLFNGPAIGHDVFQFSRGANDPKAPLALQARAVATATDAMFRAKSPYFEPASFTRLRELSITYYAAERIARAVHVRTLSITAAGRNLALWTKYTGPDPEVSTVNGGDNLVNAPGGVPSTALNNDLVSDVGSVPQMRYGTLKINVGF